jgi:2-(1,2-epoxy-1,2-dihydrophenyl)acetyl-CoA isomerase
MSTYQYLNYSVEQGVATITLNRPDVYNALNDEITYELQDALKAVSKDDAGESCGVNGRG